MRNAASVRIHPAFAGFSELLPLSGLSGAEVMLMRTRAGSRIVRKMGQDAATNRVVRRQAERQRWLRTVLEGVANVPEVILEGDVDGRYFFDMPFIPSRDAATFLATADFEEVYDFAERIESLMAKLSRTGPEAGKWCPPVKQVVDLKLAEIAARTEGRHTAVMQPLCLAVAALDSLAGASNEAPTAVHGDLTFENILVGRKGQLWLIDSIDSPFDHFWLDWSKLFQECEGRWHSYRGRSISMSVTWYLRERWMQAARRLSPCYVSRHYVLLGLTFARILPYARSAEDIAFVSSRVQAYGTAALEATEKELT
ncbi:hypothetical protein ES707_00911 [subsurface metagenome]